ncbi:TetR/AcrR family transcriptional regulator [Gordonia hydrophobica]|uniref:TetR/AcrR family transcriptional regulator n=1 Tax=Gordonia hydrophobica TaxID=40516 RepID=A0ABZ2U5A5_9ACTN|nr:TetR/AcrR family transcriptional regulator [Gordonia hydrophobica]MBM7368618.1 AcrR family transcriptional regulator [Gordonia hydrophobica]
MTTASVRDRLLTSTIALLRSKGADGFGMSELMRHSGVARRSMYLHFPDGKAQLLEQATAAAGRIAVRQVSTIASHESVPDGFAAVIETWKRTLADSDYELGCPLVAASLATAEYPAAAARAAAAFATLSDVIADALAGDGVDPDAARSAGHLLFASLEGAIITSRALRSTEPLDALEAHIRQTWD